MADIGSVLLALALVASAYSVVAFVVGERRKHRALVESARNSLLVTCGLVTLSVAMLLAALLTHDFGIDYVASYSSRSMSLPYLVSALWAGNDGSLLFWAWLLSVFSAVVVLRMWRSNRHLVAYASAVTMVTLAFFIVLLVFVSSPFEKLAVAPADGVGLNPLLENPGMVVHPPLLLAGYVGLTMPFALAIAALATGRLDERWLAAVRGWAVLSWLFLGVGNVIGAWWAYVELGWGGYWAWDPVENAGLMPMLVITAFLHSSVAQRRRAIFRVWNVALVTIAFNLAIFGTFLTRSGVLSSVHTFASTGLGSFFVVFLVLSLVGSVGLICYRRNALRGEATVESLVSREGTFLLTNVLFVGATALILLGTMFPMLSEVFGGTRIELDASYFNRVAGPLFLAILLLVGICSFTRWRQTSARRFFTSFVWPLAAALVVAVGLVVAGVGQWYALAGFVLCSFVLVAIGLRWLREVRARRSVWGEGYVAAFAGLVGLNPGRYGGYIVHAGLVILAVGVIGSSFYDVEKEAVVEQGESMAIGKYVLTYDGIVQYETADRSVVRAAVSVRNGDKLVGRLTPEKHYHRSYQQPVTEVAIRSTLVEDLYLVLIGWDEDGTAAFKVLVNPVVSWIWVGGTILLVGGVIALWPRRRKTSNTPEAGEEQE